MTVPYQNPGPDLIAVNSLAGVTLLEFGTPWCGYCRAAQAPIAAALSGHPDARHVRVEDGSGRPLGRAFRVKLWPTLIVLRDGNEVARLVRPQTSLPIAAALSQASLAG